MGDRTDLLLLDDDALLKRCHLDTFRASGPGGQHRNTTDTAVRLTLPDLGISATAVDSRSQRQNRDAALRRLRMELALNLREAPRGWKGDWKLNPRNPQYPLLMAILLDALEHFDYQVGEASDALGLSTGKLVRILADDDDVWATVNQERQTRNIHPLRPPN